MSKQLITRLAISLAIVVFLSLLGTVILFLTGLSIKDAVGILRGLVEIAALVVGTFWVLYKLYEYREFMNWIQLDIDKNLYRLGSPVKARIYSWEKGKLEHKPEQSCTHAIEVILKFTNKGNTRVRLYNIQISIFTMSPPTEETKFEETKFDEGSGHLRLTTKIVTSGNLVPIMPVLDFPHWEADLDTFEQAARQAGEKLLDDWGKQQLHDLKHEGPAKVLTKLRAIRDCHPDDTVLQKTLASLQKRAKGSKPIEKTSFYYIEPTVQQEFTYLALIPQPRELLQVAARFNLEQERLYPEKQEKIDEAIRPKPKTCGINGRVVFVWTATIDLLRRGKKRNLYSHTVARTFQVDESVPNC